MCFHRSSQHYLSLKVYTPEHTEHSYLLTYHHCHEQRNNTKKKNNIRNKNTAETRMVVWSNCSGLAGWLLWLDSAKALWQKYPATLSHILHICKIFFFFCFFVSCVSFSVLFYRNGDDGVRAPYAQWPGCVFKCKPGRWRAGIRRQPTKMCSTLSVSQRKHIFIYFFFHFRI